MDTKALRQKILDLAIRGKLVPQDPNDEPASVLLERIREQKKLMVKEGKLKARDIKNDTIIFVGEDNLHYEKFQDGTVKCIEDEIPFELPEGWAWCRLNSIASIELGKTLDAAKNTGDYKPYLRSVNVHWNVINLRDINHMKFEPNELARYSIKKGDLLICEGGDVGRSCVWENDKEIYYQNALHRVRFYMSISPYFYMYTMMYYSNIGKLQEICKGVTIKHLTRTALLTLLFPVPPKNESTNIANKILKMDSLLQDIECNKAAILDLVASTKSKILDLAIRGEFVPQDPDDEPASVLMERIRAKKEELIKQGKIKRDKNESIIFRGDDNSYYEKVGTETRCIDNEIPFEIPDSWTFVRLKHIGIIVGGGTPKTNTPSYWDGEIPWLTPADLSGYTAMYISSGGRKITEEGLKSSSAQLMPKGTVLYSSRAPIGYVAISANPIATNQGFKSVVPFNFSMSEYLYYCLKARTSDVEQRATGTTFKEISGSAMAETIIPLPPIAEQQRIVFSLQTAINKFFILEEQLS